MIEAHIKWGILILALVLSAGCGPARVIPNQRDSTILRIKDSVIFRDSMVFVNVEREEHGATLPDTDTSRLSTRYAESEAYVSGGKLHHSLRNRSEAVIPIEIKLPKVIHQEFSGIIRERREIVEVEKALSRWQQFVMALGYVFLGGLTVWLGIRIRKAMG